MTPIQRKILALMVEYIAGQGVIPTLRWLAKRLDKSPGTVVEHLNKMAAAGFIRKVDRPGEGPRRYCPANRCSSCGKPLDQP